MLVSCPWIRTREGERGVLLAAKRLLRIPLLLFLRQTAPFLLACFFSLPGTALGASLHSFEGGCRRHLQGETSVSRSGDKRSVAGQVTVVIKGKCPPPFPQRCDEMSAPPVSEKHNDSQIRWFCGASPPGPAHRRPARADWTGRRRTPLSLDRTSCSRPSLVGGWVQVPQGPRVQSAPISDYWLWQCSDRIRGRRKTWVDSWWWYTDLKVQGVRFRWRDLLAEIAIKYS